MLDIHGFIKRIRLADANPLIILLLSILVLLSTSIFSAEFGYGALKKNRNAYEQQRQKLAQRKQEYNDLVAKIGYMHSEAGQERMARARGLIRNHEKLVVW